MIATRHFRWSFLAVLALGMVVALSSCSKKDVVQDDAAMSPTEGTAAPSGDSVGTSGAGDASAGSSELSTVYFAFDSFSLTAEGRSALKNNAKWMKSNGSATAQIEGHCDERGTTEYNLALGEKRANAARDYLVKIGVEKSRLSVISYGEERPADPGHDEGAWAKNRRASFVLLSK